MMTIPDHAGMADIRLTQAQRLRAGANTSAMIVTAVITYVCIILIASNHAQNALIWACLALPMVAVTLIYARFAVSGPITKNNYARYRAAISLSPL